MKNGDKHYSSTTFTSIAEFFWVSDDVLKTYLMVTNKGLGDVLDSMGIDINEC